MPSRPSPQAFAAGLIAAFVGFGGAFTVVVRGLSAAGASPAEVASGLMAVTMAMGLSGILLSLRFRMPISVAWSTPGAALLASSGAVAGGYSYAVGAFLITGALLMLSGVVRPLGRAVAAIPTPIASAMLAGVLLTLCLAPVKAVAVSPLAGLAVVVTWLVVGLWRKVLAVPAAVIVAAVIIAMTTPIPPAVTEGLVPAPLLVMPHFSMAALIGTAIPLYVVTMAAQNIPGMAVLNANDYRPEFGPILRNTGAFTLLAAPFGGHAVNLAAITAALCAGPDADPDKDNRYWAAVVCGVAYVIVGLISGAATAFIAAAPPVLIEAVAGLALLGAFGASTSTALSAPDTREAAVVTFLVTASGVGFFGIPGAFWGLIAGIAVHLINRFRMTA